jgi:hypothetical protein
MMTNAKANAHIEALISAEKTGVAEWCAEPLCNNSRCDLRNIVIYISEYLDDSPPRVRAPFKCSACGSEVEVDRVMSGREYETNREYEARCSVNLPRLRRRLRRKPEFIPVSAYFDDRVARLNA